MALTYSLKYKKLNFFNKVLIEKEGEIVIDRQSFRLKGKGAQDLGQVIYFGDIKDILIRDDNLSFTTYSKEKYLLGNFSNLFDSFLKDFMRVKNEYLAESLFMKVGMMVREYDGQVEIQNIHEKVIPKGKCRIQFYEGGIVFIPDVKETFAVYYNFLNSHEFDEDDYVLRLFLENGQTVTISKLGTSYEEVQETLENILGKMYERLVNNMAEVMPEFDANTLLKLINKFKEVKFVPFNSLKRIDENAPNHVLRLMFEKNSIMKDKVDILRRMCGDQNFYVNVSLSRNHDNGGEIKSKCWFMCAMPENNLVTIGQTSDPSFHTVHFFRIIMQQGDAKEKLSSKVRELDQTLFIFKHDFTPIYKDKRELRKTRYKNAIKKLSFVRLLRKSYLGYSNTPDIDKFSSDITAMMMKAKIVDKPLTQARQDVSPVLES